MGLIWVEFGSKRVMGWTAVKRKIRLDDIVIILSE